MSVCMDNFADMFIEGIWADDINDIFEKDQYNLVKGVELGEEKGELGEEIIDKFTVEFTYEALVIIREMAEAFESHCAFKGYLDKSKPLVIPELERVYEQKLGMYIIEKILPEGGKELIVTETDVIYCVKILYNKILEWGYNNFKSEDTIEGLVDRYPISLVSNITKVPSIFAHMIGESVKRLVEVRNEHPDYLPKQLHNVMSGYTPLTEGENALLTKTELEAMYRYLGTKKSLYVHIVVNCLYQVSQELKYIFSPNLDIKDILIQCRSPWLFILLFGASQNNIHTNLIKFLQEEDIVII